MASFTDPEKREWKVRIPLTLYRQWRARAEPVDLLDPEDCKRITEDTPLRVGLLIESLERQGKEHDMSFEDIDDMLADNPETFVEAHEAFEVAQADFCRVMNRPTLTAIYEKTKKANQMAEEVTMKRMNSPKMDQLIEKAREQAEIAVDNAMTEAEQMIGSKNFAPSSDTAAKT